MSFEALHQAIVDAVSGIVPSRFVDDPFQLHDVMGVPFLNVAPERLRLFAIDMADVIDDLLNRSATERRVTRDLSLSVAYPVHAFARMVELEEAASADVAAIFNAIQPPDVWVNACENLSVDPTVRVSAIDGEGGVELARVFSFSISVEVLV